MQTIFIARLTREPDHVSISFAPYDIIVDAPDEFTAFNAARDMIIAEGIKRRDFRHEKMDGGGEGEPVIIGADLNAEYRKRDSAVVRKNISLPGWLDRELRQYDADASKLFQDAAKKYIEEQRKFDRKEIETVDDLIAAYPKDLLDAYVLKRLGLKGDK